MQFISRRWLGSSSVFLIGVGAATVLTLLLAAPSCGGGSNQGTSDGGTRDLAGTDPDLSTVGGVALTSITPASGLAAGGNTVTIVGAGFAPGATVTFGAVQASGVQLLSTSQLTAVVPASGGVLGPVAVAVKNPDGSTAARGDLYSYNRIQVSFMPRLTAAVGTHPVALIGSDINGDGAPEIITANEMTNNVTVLAYNQNWTNGVSYPAATTPTSLIAGDFNFNGRPDVAVACSNATNADVAVLSDNGGIGFMAPVNLKVGMNLVAIDARDVNGDTKTDLVVASRGGQAYVLSNTTTALAPSFSTGNPLTLGSQPSALALNDLDGDGKYDIVATNFGDGTVSVLLGLGGGNFGAAKVTTTTTQPIALALGDLNKDGKLDAITASFNSKQVSVLLSKGDGTFPTLTNTQVGTKPMSLAVADLDNDGNRDLIIANSGDDTVTVLLGKGNGSFEPAQSFTVGSQPFGVIVLDLNKDGKLDIATANYNSNDVSILYNQT